MRRRKGWATMQHVKREREREKETSELHQKGGGTKEKRRGAFEQQQRQWCSTRRIHRLLILTLSPLGTAVAHIATATASSAQRPAEPSHGGEGKKEKMRSRVERERESPCDSSVEQEFRLAFERLVSAEQCRRAYTSESSIQPCSAFTEPM